MSSIEFPEGKPFSAIEYSPIKIPCINCKKLLGCKFCEHALYK
ncbi:MAG: hypothetical protein ACQEQD_04625 [Bacillota bacterium]